MSDLTEDAVDAFDRIDTLPGRSRLWSAEGWLKVYRTIRPPSAPIFGGRLLGGADWLLAWYVRITALAVFALIPCGIACALIGALGGSEGLTYAPVLPSAAAIALPGFLAGLVAHLVTATGMVPSLDLDLDIQLRLQAHAAWQHAFALAMVPFVMVLMGRAVMLCRRRADAIEIGCTTLVGLANCSVISIVSFTQLTC